MNDMSTFHANFFSSLLIFIQGNINMHILEKVYF